MSLSSQESSPSIASIEFEDDEADITTPEVQVQLLVQQNSVHKKTIKQLQNAVINLQEDCATYEQKYNQVRQEGEKIYNVLISKVTMLKNLTKSTEMLQASCAMKDQMIYNQKLYLDEYKNTSEAKTLEVIEWQSQFDRANSACEDVLARLETREQENADLQSKVEELESKLKSQSDISETLASKNADIERLHKNHEEATRELTSLIEYLQAKGPSQQQQQQQEEEPKESSVSNQQELASQLAVAQARVEALLADVRAAEAIATEMTEKYSEKEKETEQLKIEVQKVVAKVVEATSRADEMAQNFRSQLEEAENTATAKDAELVDLRAQFDSLNSEEAAASEDSVASQIKKLEAKWQDAMKQAEEVSFAKVSMELELTREREELESLKAQLASAEETNSEQMAALETSMRAEIAALQNTICEHETEAESIRSSFQKEISGLNLKLQLANEMKEMKLAAVAPKPMADAEMQTEPVSTSYRRISMQQSPSVLAEQLEAMQISNELLREDNSSFQKRLDKMQESQSSLQVKVREAEARAEEISAQLKSTIEDESEQRESLLQQHAEEIARLEVTIEELLDKQNSNIEAKETVEEAKVAIEREKTWHTKLTEQTAVNQNLQNDLRLLYVKHKKDLAELQEQYQHDQYKQRYLEVVSDRNVAEKKLESLSKIMKDVTNMQTKGGFIESMKENVNTMNLQVKSKSVKVEQLRAYQVTSAQAFANVKNLEKQLNTHKTEIQKLIDDKASDSLTWSVRRSEWESLCEKIAIERDSLRSDNERISGVCAKFEEMWKSSKTDNNKLTVELDGAKEEMTKLKDTNDFLEEQVKSTEETITQLESELQNATQILAEKTSELEDRAAECTSNAEELMIEKENFVKLAREMKSLQIKSVLTDMVNNAERISWRKTETILNERINQLNVSITSYEALDQKTRDENITRLSNEVTKLNAEVAKLAAEASQWSHAHKELSEFVEDERTIKDEQLQEAEEKLKDTESRLQEQVTIATDLTNDKQTLEFECKLLHEQVEELHKEIDNRKSALLDAETEIKRISEEKDAFLEKIESCDKSAVELQESFDKKYEELLQSKKQIEEALTSQYTETQERAQATERELAVKASADAQEKNVALTRVAEVEAELVDTEQRLARKSELVQSIQDELAVFAECLKQKEKEVESLGEKLQSLLQANTQKEAELNVKENETSMKLNQVNSELEIARGQATQLQTENARLKKAVSEVTSQTMAVNSRHLDAASKLRETIAQLTEKSEKSAKDCEVAEKLSSELSSKVAELEKKNADLVEKASTSEKVKQGGVEMEKQCKKLMEELKVKSDKLEEASAKLSACVATNNNLNAKVKELHAEKGAHEEEVTHLKENQAKLKSRLASLEVSNAKDQQSIGQLKQASTTSMANEAKLELELRKAASIVKALKGENEKLSTQLESCLRNSSDQEQSTILRMKFNLEREVAKLLAINDTAKGDLARFTEDMERYKASVGKFKERTESKMKVQATNLQKAEEEVEALDTCLKQLRILLARHEPLFQRVPELTQLYSRLLAMMGQQGN